MDSTVQGSMLYHRLQLTKKLDDYPGLALDAFEELIGAAGGLSIKAQRDLCDDVAKELRDSDYAVARVRLFEGSLLEQAQEERKQI